MSLSDFKNKIKLAGLFVFLVAYGMTSFILGKNSLKIPFGNVKGVSTQKDLKSPQNIPIPASDTQTSSIKASYSKACPNTTYSFEISYPKDWFTTYNLDSQKCNFFAPYSFVVPQDTNGFQIPIKLEVFDPNDWETTVKFYENPNDFQNIISSQNLEIDGRAVKKITAQTPSLQKDKTLVKISYLIFSSEKPAIITYQQINADEDTQNYSKVLDEMVQTFRYY